MFHTSDKIKQNRLVSTKVNDNLVWCLNVPLSNFMVRREGTHYFTGNCWYVLLVVLKFNGRSRI